MRKNKSKKEIVSDIQLVQDSDRRRALIKDVLFPYLLEMKESISYTKVFIQAFYGLVNGVFDERAKTTTVGDLEPRILEKVEEVFKKNGAMDDEKAKYTKLVSLLKDISVQDLAYAAELPRYIDGFIIQGEGKKLLETVDLNKIMG
jgi:hypothetical protein